MSNTPTNITADQAMQIAIAHHQAGRLGEAEAIYRQVIAQNPNHAVALHYLGVIAAQCGHQASGIALLRRAIAIKSDYAEAYANVGLALARIGQSAEAIEACNRAIALNPNFADAHSNLGIALADSGRHDEALEAFRRAVKLDPAHVQALTNLGNALFLCGRPDEARDCYKQALQRAPADPDALLNYGNTLKAVGLNDDAIATYRQALRLNPRQPAPHGNLVYSMLFRPDVTAPQVREELGRWNEIQARPLPRVMPQAADRNPDRRLRIGYVSPDFRDHVVGRNVLPLLRNHDHTNFEVFCYANVSSPDAVTAQFQQFADHWRPIFGQSDQQVAEQVREDRIDILVDMALHMSGSRLLVFARQPAPVQITFAGYPGSTGLDTIQYRLTDPDLEPPGGDDHFWSEKPVRLPHSFWCYEPSSDAPPVNLLPALQAGHITFGSFNNFSKVNETVLKLWAAVMNGVPGSRLILLVPEGSARRRTSESLERLGIARDRAEFIAFVPHKEYFAAHHRVDIGLETFPYNGHTTSLDALWMGVPVPTLVGALPVSRAGLSHLTNLGLPELIAHDPREFVKIVTELSKDLPRLTELRAKLRDRLQKSPLMDATGFARSIEQAYCTMWRNYCAT